MENRYLGGVANWDDWAVVEAVCRRVETPEFSSSRRRMMLFFLARA